MANRWPARKDGEWFRVYKAQKIGCCDCSLVHIFKFKTKKDGSVWMSASRDNRATANKRRNTRITIPQRS